MQQLQRDALIASAGKMWLKIVASRLSNYCETEGIFPEEQQSVRLPPRTINDRYAVRRALVARARTTEESPPGVHALHIRLCRSRAAVGRSSHALAYQPRCLYLSAISSKTCALACVRMTASTRNDFMSRRGCGKAACYHHYCCSIPGIFFAALHVVLVFTLQQKGNHAKSQGIWLNSTAMEESDHRSWSRWHASERAGWGMLHADDTGIVSKSAAGLSKMMSSHRYCLRSSTPHSCIGKQDKRQCCYEHRTRQPSPHRSPSKQQRSKQTAQFLHLGGIIHENGDLCKATRTANCCGCLEGIFCFFLCCPLVYRLFSLRFYSYLLFICGGIVSLAGCVLYRVPGMLSGCMPHPISDGRARHCCFLFFLSFFFLVFRRLFFVSLFHTNVYVVPVVSSCCYCCCSC